jgi:hypothetical protein
MAAIIERLYDTNASITASTSAATTSGRFSFSRLAGAAVVIANTNSATQVRWYGATGAETVPFLLFDASGAAVTSGVTVGGLAVPDACFAYPWLVPVASGGTVQMTVCAKG